MYAVGDRADRYLVGVEAGPQVGEHLATDRAVQLRHPVGSLTETKTHVRHVEYARVRFVAEFENGARRQPRQEVRRSVGSRIEIEAHEIVGEAVDPGGDGCVRREDRRRSDDRLRRIEVESSGVDELADPLDTEEAGMALVHVEDGGLCAFRDADVFTQCPDSADSQQDLLLDAVILIAAVEPIGDAAQLVVVGRDVGIEEQQRDSTDRGHPHLCVQRASAGHRDLDDHGFLRGVGQQRQR